MINNESRKLKPKTHRCKKSIEECVSIRCKDGVFILYDIEWDLDTDTHFARKVAEIEYCPFCGKKLSAKPLEEECS